MLPFVPLRIFSSYTMLEGAIDPGAIARRASELGFPAAALADRNGLYAAMPFSHACIQLGVQPIVGAFLAVARPDRDEGKTPPLDWLALYAQNEAGWRNLLALVSAAHLDRPPAEPPHVPLCRLEGCTEGLIALGAGGEGALARLIAEGQEEEAGRMAERLQALFTDRFYIELSRRGDSVEEAAEAGLIDMAYARSLPLVATNPASYAEPGFHDAHDALLCIANSSQIARDDRPRSSPHAWIKPDSAMRDLFADLPEAIANSATIARRCAFAAPVREPILPSIAGDQAAEAEQLRRDAREGLTARLAAYAGLGEEERAAYDERLDYELDLIVRMGFAAYFLIVADFIKWAKDAGIPVGPARGSGGGSLVAWALTITGLDPLRLGLLFERFLNPERITMPDFDIDFCETRRGEVLRYVQQRYGADRVAQIITFGTLKARAVLKDIGRVLQMPYMQVDRLAKLVPATIDLENPWTLKRTLREIPEFAQQYEGDTQVRGLIDLAMKLEGLPRHVSTHAAGVVIADRRLDLLVPLFRDPRSDMPVTQFDMKYVEKAGLVKFDFLGLKTLSVLDKAKDMLANQGVAVDFETLTWDDPQVYELLQRGDTVGVFQLESEGMRRTLAAVKPTRFEDIIALVSLYRPGPMNNIPAFGDRKNGREPITYPHPLLEVTLAETYGIFVYQEQVLEAAKILAGFSLGEADVLRRAMGKKIKSEMDSQRARFVAGCQSLNGIPPERASELFDLIDKFSGYGFNKSHAAGYAVIAYQTAWLKAHHPLIFYAASMSFDMAQTDKLAIFVEDMRRGGHRLLAPSINRSRADFTIEVEGDAAAVRYALAALKNVGEKAMEQLIDEREKGGDFASLEDFAARVDPTLLNRRQIESLAGAGAFDGVAGRAEAFDASETILAIASSAARGRETGQHGLFGGGAANVVPIRIAKSEPWATPKILAAEKESLGFYLSGHPVDAVRQLAERSGARSYASLAAQRGSIDGGRTAAVMAALVEDVRWRTSQRGTRYATATLSDESGQYEASAFDEHVAKRMEEAARASECALFKVELDRRPGEDAPRITIRSLQSFESLSRTMRLRLDLAAVDADAVRRLGDMLAGMRGGTGEVHLRVQAGEGMAVLVLGRDFRIDAALEAQLIALEGLSEVTLTTIAPAPLALVS